jgi:hypothetical protein
MNGGSPATRFLASITISASPTSLARRSPESLAVLLSGFVADRGGEVQAFSA